ncbi:MAG: alpha/beta fold hydrolase [Bacteroidia bacterium]|nr:alpha/beta fold hydrolase [Bacteroidia bacterium]
MNKLFTLFFLFSACISVSAQEITGSWSGTLNIMGNKLPIVFHISKTDTVYTTKIDSPAQNALGLPTTRTSFADTKLEIVATGLGIFYQGTLQGDSISGIFNQGGMSFPLVLKQSDKPVLNRPQEPKPPFPYKTEDITFSNKKDNIELAGTLTLPDSAGKFPAVILIAGSGPNDRDETIFGHKPFLVIADYLTRNGFVVLRYDKRGIGQSKGDLARATTHDFATDASAAIEYLRTRKEVDKSSIGLIGHSEGGVVAPMVVAENKNVKFIVLLAGVGITGMENTMLQNQLELEPLNMEPENLERTLKMIQETLESLSEWEGTETDRTALRDRISQLWEQYPLLVKLELKKDAYVRNQFNAMSSPWFRQFLQLNPADYLQKVKCPVLALNGEKDTQVLADKNLEAIKSALDKGRNYRYEIKSYPNLNHLFQECETGNVDEYGRIEQTISPEVLSDIKEWMQRTIFQKEK